METSEYRKAVSEKMKELRTLIADDRTKGFIMISVDGDSADIEGSSSSFISLQGNRAVLARGFIGAMDCEPFKDILLAVNTLMDYCDIEGKDE